MKNSRPYLPISLLVMSLFSPTAHAQGSNLFFVPPTYPGTGAVSADFNGDGKPDLITADGTLLIGNGDGTFTTKTPLAGFQGQVVGIGDFNGDGKVDLVVMNSTNLDIFFGNGDGTFQAPVITNVGTGLGSVVVADVNGDGKPDVVGLSSAAALVVVLLGKGNGTFAPAVTFPALTNTINLLTLADFNGDGKLDIALASDNGLGTAGSVGVLLGNGDGTFRTVMTSTGITSPHSVLATDFNGDGRLDLAISGSGNTAGSGLTYILFGNGDGTFQAPGPPIPGYGSLTAPDMNGDGKPDLVIGGDPFAQVFLGKGDGTFMLKSTYLVDSTEKSVVIADFNGDGKLDVASGNTILLGNGDGTLQGDIGTPVGSVGLGQAVTGDFDGNGTPDLAVISQDNANDLYILLNEGTGTFSLAHTYTLPLPFDAIATADVNSDGKLDIVFTTHDPSTIEWSLNVMLGNGDGSFGSPTTFPQGAAGEIDHIAFADFNGDHKPDLAVISAGFMSVFLGNGDGTFTPIAGLFAGSAPTSFVAADFNNDGFDDLAVVSSAGLGVLLGEGNGTFQPPMFTSSNLTQLTAAADLNGDGNVDLIGAVGFLQVLLGNGDGTFDALPSTNQSVGGLVSVADINGDGKPDLIESSGVNVSLGNGDGTFTNPAEILSPGARNLRSQGSEFVVVADFNGDGHPDVAADVDADVVTLINTAPPPGPDFLITSTPLKPATLAPGSSATSTITLTAIGGFSSGVTLSCTGLPSGATCSFAPGSLPSSSGTSAVTIATASSTPFGTYPVTIIGTSSGPTHQRVLTLTVATSAGATTVSLAPQTLTFPQQAIGSPSSSQVLVLTNTGNASLSISSIAISGTNASDFSQTNTCGPSLAAGMNCQISVTFNPTGVGARSATLVVTDNATGSPQMVTLAGTEPDFSMSPGAASTATVTAGQTATYMISVAPVGAFAQTVALACAGAPAKSTCTVSPGSVVLNGAVQTVTVSITTTAASGLFLPTARYQTPGTRFRIMLLVLLAAMGMVRIASFLRRKGSGHRWVPVTLGVLLCAAILLAACGGNSGGDSGGGGTIGTQAGTYTVKVSGTFTSGSTTLTHTTNLTLIVQ